MAFLGILVVALSGAVVWYWRLKMAREAGNEIIDSVEPKITQLMTFTHDTRDLFDLHRSMTLHSRNNQGVWEPKIASGRGYTVSVASAAGDTRVSAFAGPPGIPRYINVGLTDMLKPDARAKPFYSRVGVCYTNKDGSHPAATFEIERVSAR